MELKQGMKFDLVERAEGLALVLRDTPPWYGKVIFFTEQPDGSLTITNIIQEQGPSWAYSTVTALTLKQAVDHELRFPD